MKEPPQPHRKQQRHTGSGIKPARNAPPSQKQAGGTPADAPARRLNHTSTRSQRVNPLTPTSTASPLPPQSPLSASAAFHPRLSEDPPFSRTHVPFPRRLVRTSKRPVSELKHHCACSPHRGCSVVRTQFLAAKVALRLTRVRVDNRALSLSHARHHLT